MDKGKETKIIAISDGTPCGVAAVHAAASLASAFRASLIIITRFSFSTRSTQTTSYSPINYKTQIDNSLSVLIEEKPLLPDTLHQYAEQVNAIMYVIGVSTQKQALFHRKRAMKFIKPSRLPVLTVGEKGAPDPNWQNVFVSLDIYRQEKEKALWAGYFYRFAQSKIHLLHASYRDEFLKQKVTDNLNFVKKLYANLEIPFQIDCLEHAVDNMDNYVLTQPQSVEPSLLVVMTTQHYSLIDMLFGVKEKQYLANKRNIPVLYINERDDLYVLCT